MSLPVSLSKCAHNIWRGHSQRQLGARRQEKNPETETVLDKANVENVEGETETLKFIESNVKQSNKLWQHGEGRVWQCELSGVA